jgi:hypothetical protein
VCQVATFLQQIDAGVKHMREANHKPMRGLATYRGGITTLMGPRPSLFDADRFGLSRIVIANSHKLLAPPIALVPHRHLLERAHPVAIVLPLEVPESRCCAQKKLDRVYR